MPTSISVRTLHDRAWLQLDRMPAHRQRHWSTLDPVTSDPIPTCRQGLNWKLGWVRLVPKRCQDVGEEKKGVNLLAGSHVRIQDYKCVSAVHQT